MGKRSGLAMATFWLMLSISGCTHVISRDTRNMAAKDIPFQWVAQNPERFRGILVIWGGEIIEVRNTQEGPVIEVLQRPLGYSEEPDEERNSEGRFLVLIDTGFLDPSVFRRGTKITVAGMLEGEKKVGISGVDYPYPYLIAREFYVWNEHEIPPYPLIYR